METLLQWAEVRPLRWLVTMVWMGFFIILLVQPEKNPFINTGIPPGPQTLEREIFFTSMHLLGFFITTVLWWWTLWGHVPSKHAVIMAVVISIVLSFTTEWMQGFVPDRYPQVSDLIANAAGAGLVYLVVMWLSKRQHEALVRAVQVRTN